jgi:flagellar protein FlgJ
MSDMAITSAALPAAAAPSKADSPEKVHDAAQQFEALLIGQILRSARQGGSGWFSDGEDPSGEIATDYAEQQFATVLSQNGGLGLADMISKGLDQRQAAVDQNKAAAQTHL